MGTLGTLAVSIIGDPKKLEQTFDGINKKTAGFSQNMQKMGKQVGNVGWGMTKWVTGPIVAVGAGLLGLASKAGSFADELLDLEAATGISTDRLQNFRAAEAAAGTETDAIADSILRMNRQMKDAGEYSTGVTNAAERYEVSLRKANGEVRDAEEVHHDLMMAIAGIEDPQERARAGSEAFGRDWEQIAPVVALGREELERIYDQDVIDKEKLEQADEFRRFMEELKHEFSMVAMEIGTELAPMMLQLGEVIRDRAVPFIQGLIERIGGLIEWFQNLSPTWQKVIGYAIGFAAVLGPILIVVGKVITVLGVIIPVVAQVGAVIAAVAAGPAVLIVAAIVAIIAIGIALWKNWDKIAAFFGNLWETVKGYFAAAWEWIANLFLNYTPHGLVIQHWDVISGWFGDLWETVKGIFGAAWDWIKATVESAFNAVAGTITTVWATITGTFERARNTIKGIIDRIIGFFTGIPGRIRSAVAGVFDIFMAPFNRIRDGIGKVTSGIGGALKTISPWHRSSPSLVEQVESGTKKMLEDFKRLDKELEIAPLAHTVRETEMGRLDVGGRVEVVLSGEGAQHLSEAAIADAVTAKIARTISDGNRRMSTRTRITPIY